LNNVGVALGLVHWRDIWKGPDGQIKITNFEYVYCLELINREEIERQEELQNVKGLTPEQLMASAYKHSLRKAAELFLYPDYE
jgi:hypothetical protein